MGIGRIADFHGGPSGKVDGKSCFGVVARCTTDQGDTLIDIPNLDVASAGSTIVLAIGDGRFFRLAPIGLVDRCACTITAMRKIGCNGSVFVNPDRL